MFLRSRRMREVRIFLHTFCWSYSISHGLLMLLFWIIFLLPYDIYGLHCASSNYSLQAYFLWSKWYSVNAWNLRSCQGLGCMWWRLVFPSGTSVSGIIVRSNSPLGHSKLPGDLENLHSGQVYLFPQFVFHTSFKKWSRISLQASADPHIKKEMFQKQTNIHY